MDARPRSPTPESQVLERLARHLVCLTVDANRDVLYELVRGTVNELLYLGGEAPFVAKELLEVMQEQVLDLLAQRASDLHSRLRREPEAQPAVPAARGRSVKEEPAAERRGAEDEVEEDAVRAPRRGRDPVEEDTTSDDGRQALRRCPVQNRRKRGGRKRRNRDVSKP